MTPLTPVFQEISRIELLWSKHFLTNTLLIARKRPSWVRRSTSEPRWAGELHGQKQFKDIILLSLLLS
jgi:hypothetical protein